MAYATKSQARLSITAGMHAQNRQHQEAQALAFALRGILSQRRPYAAHPAPAAKRAFACVAGHQDGQREADMTPFDGRILWWHWQGAAVEEASIGELVASVKNNTPNVAGVSVKSSNGRNWQGALDSKAAMAVTGPDALERWAAELGKAGLELHLWCVLHGQDLEAEAARVVEACRVPGVRSLTLDVEAGPRYFGSQPPETARRFAAHLRDALPETHLGLCFFLDDMAAIHFSEWLPHVSSLHPMLYHWDVGKGQAEPEPLIERAFSQLAPYGLPVVPVLQTYPNPESGKPVPEAHITRAAEYAFARGAAGVGYFRLGAAGEEIFWAIRRLGQPG